MSLAPCLSGHVTKFTSSYFSYNIKSGNHYCTLKFEFYIYIFYGLPLKELLVFVIFNTLFNDAGLSQDNVQLNDLMYNEFEHKWRWSIYGIIPAFA
jgi:hypothetical protein